jgi:hypothetical protein
MRRMKLQQRGNASAFGAAHELSHPAVEHDEHAWQDVDEDACKARVERRGESKRC